MMEREQIIKALECCEKDDCDNCPNDIKNCIENLAVLALSLIREQDKRIEELENICDSYALQYGTATDKEVFLKQERAATVRKMQSEIEARCIAKGIYPVIVKNVVDEVAKEILEGEKCQMN